jgi:hypothetical protein
MIEFDIRPRQGGKTNAMLEWLAESQGRVLMVDNPDTARILARRRPGLASRIMTPYDGRRQLNRGFNEIGIDDLDSFFGQWIPGAGSARVTRVSATGLILPYGDDEPVVTWPGFER